MQMSELQIGLIAVGVAVVAAVFGYNKWLEYRQRKAIRAAHGNRHDDVLMGSRHGSGEEGGAVARTQRVEPELTAQGGAVEPGSVPEPAPHLADPRLDCVVRVDTAEALKAGAFMLAQREAIGDTDKPLRWLGFNAESGDWDSLTAHSARAYRHWCGCMQLVDRRGPLGASGLRHVREGLNRLADRFLAVTEMEDDATLTQRAVELDRACAELDIQVGLNVVAAPGAWFPDTALARTAESLGGVGDEEGNFQFPDGSGVARYLLVRENAQAGEADAVPRTRALTMLLDVPRVTDAPAHFDDMARVARRLCTNLQGVLVDDNGNPVADEALSVIREQIRQHQEKMTAMGMAPGSAAALRLFG